MTMHINLSEEMEAYIKGKVAAGFYGNATEVIRDAIRRMYDEDARVTAFQDAVAEGDADVEAGRVYEYTEDTMDELINEVLVEKYGPAKAGARG
ncbi:MAG: type II toxin-antitoxin system ParD family antitoxin [Asticcacaulis sp.]